MSAKKLGIFVGLPGNRRELTAERIVEGVMRNGRATGWIKSAQSPRPIEAATSSLNSSSQG